MTYFLVYTRVKTLGGPSANYRMIQANKAEEAAIQFAKEKAEERQTLASDEVIEVVACEGRKFVVVLAPTVREVV